MSVCACVRACVCVCVCVCACVRARLRVFTRGAWVRGVEWGGGGDGGKWGRTAGGERESACVYAIAHARVCTHTRTLATADVSQRLYLRTKLVGQEP